MSRVATPEELEDLDRRVAEVIESMPREPCEDDSGLSPRGYWMYCQEPGEWIPARSATRDPQAAYDVRETLRRLGFSLTLTDSGTKKRTPFVLRTHSQHEYAPGIGETEMVATARLFLNLLDEFPERFKSLRG